MKLPTKPPTKINIIFNQTMVLIKFNDIKYQNNQLIIHYSVQNMPSKTDTPRSPKLLKLREIAH